MIWGPVLGSKFLVLGCLCFDKRRKKYAQKKRVVGDALF